MFDKCARFGAFVTLLGATTLLGCDGGQKSQAIAERHHENDGHDHSTGEHSHEGPHGGHLVELGTSEEFHAEVIHDDKSHRVTVYILDGKAKENVPISQNELTINMVNGGAPKQYKLAAVTQANELPNMASCFQLEDEELCEALDSPNAKGRMAVTVNGKHYVGEIEHHEHGEHEHGNEGEHKGK